MPVKNLKSDRIKETLKKDVIISVHWADITQHDKVRVEDIPGRKFLTWITKIPPTITYGRFIGIENDCIVVSQEYCTDEGSDATMLEVIPVGCIIRIEIFKTSRTMKF